MYAFAKRPRWIVLHVVLAIVVGLFALAGVWQLQRLSDRREHNAYIREQRAARPIDIDRAFDSPDAAEHRRVIASGRYDTEREIVLRGRGDRSRPGNHVLTPLVVSGGRAVLVDRGWIPFDLDEPPVRQARPPAREVEVEGIALPTEGSGPFGGSANASQLRQVSRIDVARIADGFPYETFPLYLALTDQDPPPSRLPEPLTPLPLDEGSHQLYAVQWFLFMVIAVVGYAAILRREARKSAELG